MRFSLPSIECQSVAAEDFNISSLELDVFVLHLALVGTLTQILLTTPEEIPTGTSKVQYCKICEPRDEQNPDFGVNCMPHIELF